MISHLLLHHLPLFFRASPKLPFLRKPLFIPEYTRGMAAPYLSFLTLRFLCPVFLSFLGLFFSLLLSIFFLPFRMTSFVRTSSTTSFFTPLLCLYRDLKPDDLTPVAGKQRKDDMDGIRSVWMNPLSETLEV